MNFYGSLRPLGHCKLPIETQHILPLAKKFTCPKYLLIRPVACSAISPKTRAVRACNGKSYHELVCDGGWSGGTMNRAAISPLVEGVKASKVDVIIVYKVDRLTCSLADFARIVEIFDENEASFVSVTQSFNTTTSMGRLTLNVLRSLAQFKREVTGERISEEIAASKKKGIWMGGPIPIGHDLQDHKLVIYESEAKAVRHMFRRYTKLKSVLHLVDELAADGYRTKQRLNKGERVVGGI